MPLIKRTVEPVHLSRGAALSGTPNELECVTNHTLSNIIRQLSSLSYHAQDIFSELTEEVTVICGRATKLHNRVERLSHNVKLLDSSGEEVSLQDINTRKPFKSIVSKDHQIMSANTRSAALSATYKQCEAPPPLNKLNVFREDGKDSLKFYTDTTYFFELWQQKMFQSVEEAQKNSDVKRKKRHRKAKPHIKLRDENAEKYKQQRLGKEFEVTNKEKITGFGRTAIDSQNDFPKQTDAYNQNGYNVKNDTVDNNDRTSSPASSRNSRIRPMHPPPAPPPSVKCDIDDKIHHSNDVHDFPPPPPMPIDYPPEPSSPINIVPPPPPPPPPMFMENNITIPPAPPPPTDMPKISENTSGSSFADEIRSKQLKKVDQEAKKTEEPKQDLLESIRQGITLRKVEKTEEATKKTNVNDVQAIMEIAFGIRRRAVEVDEDDSESDDDDNDDEWDDKNTDC